ncbi:MAG: hypothetical protein R3E68_11910 [Burkholderiaceae bacterium]
MIRAVNLTARPFTRELASQYGLSRWPNGCLQVLADSAITGLAARRARSVNRPGWTR